jgi:hypothetical protein
VKGAFVKVAHRGEILAGGVTDPRGVFDTVSVVRVQGKAVLEEVPDVIEEVEVVEGDVVEIAEPVPGREPPVMVVAEKDGHAAAWW